MIETNSNGIVNIVDPDLIRAKLSSKFDFKIEKEVRQKHLAQVENFLKNGMITISDDLNYYSSMRHELKEIAERL